MKKKYGEFLFKLLAVTLAAFIVFHFTLVGGFFSSLFSALQPVFIGIVLAMAMGVPLRFFQTKLFRKCKSNKVNEGLSLTLTFVLFGGILALLGVLIVPQGIESIKEIVTKFSENGLSGMLNEIGFLRPLEPFIDKIYQFLTKKITTFVPKILETVQTIFTGIYNIVFGVIIAVMLIIGRKKVKEQLKKLIELLFKEKNERVRSFLLGASEKFSKYLGGQLIEACILGSACYVTMLLLRVPCAALVSLIIGFANLIPTIGAYVGGAVCTIIVFAVSPIKSLVFLAAILILQQVEGFTTYPAIVGKYVGLNGFWTTVSVIFFGAIFGFWGMFLGVPLTAFLFDLFENYYDRKQSENNLLQSLRK